MRRAVGMALALLPLTACAPDARDTPTLATVFDSSGDTIVAHVRGVVSPSHVRHVVQELSIAPGVDDTTLFTRVNSFTVDSAGRSWVFDQSSGTIFLFGSDGTLLRRIGRRGAGPGELRSENGSVALSGDRHAVWDAQNARINWYGADGTFERSSAVPARFYTLGGLATDRTGGVFIKQQLELARTPGPARLGLVRVRPDGTFGDTLAPPDLHVPTVGYTASTGGSRATYSSRNAAGAYWLWHPDGYFVTVDGARSRIVLSRRTTKPMVIERALPRVPVPPDEQADDKGFITWGLRTNVPDWKWTGPDVPDTKPTFGPAIAGRDGRIWVRVATPSERIPDAELPASRPDGPPPYRFRSSIEWEVYASDGTFVGRVALPRDTQLMQADGNLLWALGRDDNDLPAVRRYRVDPPFASRGGP